MKARSSAVPAAAGPQALMFRDGNCTGIVTSDGREVRTAELVARGMLSLTDRMILSQIAARVATLSRQLDSGENQA